MNASEGQLDAQQTYEEQCGLSADLMETIEGWVRSYCAEKGYETFPFQGARLFWPRMDEKGTFLGKCDLFVKFPNGNITSFEVRSETTEASVQAALAEAAALPYIPLKNGKRGNTMNASEVKQGDRVVYRAQGTEYNGIAMSDAKVGVHPGVKRAGIYLDISYLTENGAAVKVLSSPAQVTDLTEQDVDAIVGTEIAARSLDHRRSTLPENGGDVSAAAVREEVLAMKQASGWKVCGGTEDALRVALQQTTETLQKLTAERDALKAEIDAMQVATWERPNSPEHVPFEAETSAWRGSKLPTNRAAGCDIPSPADGSSATGVAPLPDVSPDGSPAV